MKDTRAEQIKQYSLEEAHAAIRLARRKAEVEPPTTETLAEIEKLCATSEISLARAIREQAYETEAKEAATTLLVSSTANTDNLMKGNDSL